MQEERQKKFPEGNLILIFKLKFSQFFKNIKGLHPLHFNAQSKALAKLSYC